jgi:LAO/AO transport system kinase
MTSDPYGDVGALARLLLSGDRQALAKAITLVESTRADHQDSAALLLDLVATGRKHKQPALRVAISGPPGVGKSTLIEALGLFLISKGKQVAVLAIDPSSPVLGGSLLADKTRMNLLSKDPHAFIRPSPSSNFHGGVAVATSESVLLCEAAGFDPVLIETVGVGQSEVEAAFLVDIFVLLLPPGGGDELQGLKKGVLELADVIVVNKADGDLENLALATAASYRAAMALTTQAGMKTHKVSVLSLSALEKKGIQSLWDTIEIHHHSLVKNGQVGSKHDAQAEHWFWQSLEHQCIEQLKASPRIRKITAQLLHSVRNRELSGRAAALKVLSSYLPNEK